MLVESRYFKRRLGGWREVTASLTVNSRELNSERELVKIGPERVKLKNLHC
jgi:hypothetical protein